MRFLEAIRRIFVTICRQGPGITISMALLLLMAAAVILTIGKKGLAVQLGDFSFYFLVLGVILVIIRLISNVR